MAAILMSLRTMQAGLACLLAGLLIAIVLPIAQRYWPGLAARRGVWLGGQVALAAVFFLSLIPQTAGLSVLPALALAKPDMRATRLAPAPRPIAEVSTGAAGPAQTADVAPSTSSLGDILIWLPEICLCAYCSGLLWKLLAVLRGRNVLRALFAASERLSTSQLRQHGAFGATDLAALERHGLTVWETDAAISPMLTGVWRPRLLLPSHLRTFTEEQQRLIVLHELTHWRRHDPWYQALGQAVQILLWFNPVLPWLGRKLNWAQELGCDRQVLAGRPQRERQSYAAALVRQLAFQALGPGGVPGLAFGAADAVGTSMAARVILMRQTSAVQFSAAGKGVLAAAFGLVVVASMLLQPAFAWLPSPAPMLATVQPWSYPLDQMQVVSFYGVVSKLLPDGHHGIDLAAKQGTPIHAVAAGTVTVGHNAHYGNFVAIDHERHWRTLYAHLDVVEVRTGEIIATGQPIGKVGATGMATGPHLHVEVWRDGQRVDPQIMLAGLDQGATARALSVRKAQLGH